MLPTSGDGNCLFASLSYWVTGNMDHVNILKTIIVDCMIGKLSVARNIPIVNTFPMSGIHTIRDMIHSQNVNIKYSRLWSGI